MCYFAPNFEFVPKRKVQNQVILQRLIIKKREEKVYGKKFSYSRVTRQGQNH
jgi:hypothetical protein